MAKTSMSRINPNTTLSCADPIEKARSRAGGRDEKKNNLGFRSKGKPIIGDKQQYQLRESVAEFGNSYWNWGRTTANA